VPLPIRNLGARQKDVLPSTSLGLFLLDLDLHDFTRVLDDLGDVGDVSASDLTQDTLGDKDETTRKPVPPKHTNDVKVANTIVGFDHAEHAVELPADKEHDEQVVGVPKLFESTIGRSSTLLYREPDHDAKSDRHDPSGHAGSSGKIENEEFDRRVGRGTLGEYNSEDDKVVHVCYDVYRREEDDGPGGGDMELDVVIEGDDHIERRLSQQRDKVAAYREQDKDHIDVQYERGRTSKSYIRSKMG
jgi:hypothetical protein